MAVADELEAFALCAGAAVHGAEAGEAGSGEGQCDVFEHAVLDAAGDCHVGDLAGGEEAEGVGHMDEVVEHDVAEYARGVRLVLLQDHGLAWGAGGGDVGRRVAAVEADHEGCAGAFGVLDQRSRLGEGVGQWFVDIGRDAGVEEPRDDLDVGDRRDVHERRLRQIVAEQRVHLREAALRGHAVRRPERVEPRPITRHQPQPQVSARPQHRQVRTARDASQPDHRDLEHVFVHRPHGRAR